MCSLRQGRSEVGILPHFCLIYRAKGYQHPMVERQALRLRRAGSVSRASGHAPKRPWYDRSVDHLSRILVLSNEHVKSTTHTCGSFTRISSIDKTDYRYGQICSISLSLRTWRSSSENGVSSQSLTAAFASSSDMKREPSERILVLLCSRESFTISSGPP